MTDPRVRLARVQLALDMLRQAQSALRSVGAHKAAEAVGRARKSVEGAERHAHGLVIRADREIEAIDGLLERDEAYHKFLAEHEPASGWRDDAAAREAYAAWKEIEDGARNKE